ncbi:MAG TPA: hypothetical protein VFE46_02790, partial [Pirellulales bacterium]|nr:hypothetical protein [Pirellulales bacterium]
MWISHFHCPVVARGGENGPLCNGPYKAATGGRAGAVWIGPSIAAFMTNDPSGSRAHGCAGATT